MANLEHSLRFVQAVDAHAAEVPQRDVGRQSCDVGSDLRAQDLAAGSERAKPRCPARREPAPVVVPQLGLAGVDGHAHTHRRGEEGDPELNGGGDGIGRRPEHAEGAVALAPGLHHRAAAVLDGGAGERLDPLDRRRRLRRPLLPRARRALDVGQQERDGLGRHRCGAYEAWGDRFIGEVA